MKSEIPFKDHPTNDLFQFALSQSKSGFWKLPDENINQILDFSEDIRERCIVVIGIGGSSLGIEALYNFLNPKMEYEKDLLFLDTTDPIQLANQLEKIDLSSSMFFAVSKSGTTVETIAILKYLDSILHFSRDNLVVITDKDSPLQKFGESRSLKIFNIPTDVGGRYSVLSPAGLLPLLSVGVDVEELLRGARDIKRKFLSGGCENLLQKAYFLAKNVEKFDTNVIFSYSNSLRSFNDWYMQLWGESLGKNETGLTPVGLIGPRDQHSFLQLLMEGQKNKTVSFIQIEEMGTGLSIPNSPLPHLEKLNILNGIEFINLINLQADSTKESLQNIGVPVDTITLESISERSIGGLIFYFEILTTLVAHGIGVNPFGQNGVEEGKRILKEKLSFLGEKS
ncbi:glucose-6-phosphate isomerase [Thiovulum sp. ES]|nr:glucose-6-phosphate isomerase [Thiovulum sp. ES]